jgi:hypothetical protein
LSIKVLFKLSLSQTVGIVASLLRMAGLDWPVPYFSTLCRRQKALAVQIPYRRPDDPMNLLVGNSRDTIFGHPRSLRNLTARRHASAARRRDMAPVDGVADHVIE